MLTNFRNDNDYLIAGKEFYENLRSRVKLLIFSNILIGYFSLCAYVTVSHYVSQTFSTQV